MESDINYGFMGGSYLNWALELGENGVVCTESDASDSNH